MRRRNRIAIYAPRSTGMYERRPVRVGGAERQMALLATTLARRDVPVAHIVFAPSDPSVPGADRLTLVTRGAYAGRNGMRSRLTEARRIWRGLAAADSDVYVVRGGSPALGIAALFCRLHRRRLVFSSANDSDFTLETLSGRRHRVALYRAGLGSASAIVVQSEHQLGLAREVLRRPPHLERIPSFGERLPDETPGTDPPEAFLWIGRLIAYKRPLEYLELARALPEYRFRMVGVANESQQYADEVRERAAGIPNLELIEPRPHDEMMQLLWRSIAVVSTSRLEGMPNIFLEAWARGVPVLSLSFDPDGVIGRHRLGIAAGGDWQRFTRAAREFAAGGGVRDGVADRGRAYIRSTHSPDAVADRWLALLKRLDDNGGGGSS